MALGTVLQPQELNLDADTALPTVLQPLEPVFRLWNGPGYRLCLFSKIYDGKTHLRAPRDLKPHGLKQWWDR